MLYKLFTDGGARGNPGPAAYGFAIFDDTDKLIAIDAKYLGNQTNNYAEYRGLKAALEYISKQNLSSGNKFLCHLDSELIVKQLNGEYKVKNPDLKQIYNEVQILIENLPIKFVHVPREQNRIADKLVNISLDTASEKS